jgi:hypothetical protein
MQECWEDRNDCPQDNDAVTNLHVVARIEAPFQRRGQSIVPIAHLSTEIFVVQKLFGSTSSGVDALSEAMQLALAAKCLFIVDLLL